MMKKTLKTICGFILVFAFCCLSITDVNAEKVELLRSGYHHGEVYHNDKLYSYDAYFQMDGKGIRTVISTSAYIARRHDTITVQFNTYNHGYNTVSGGFRDIEAKSGTSVSYTVHCSYGDSQVISYNYMHGYVRLYGDSQVNYYLSA